MSKAKCPDCGNGTDVELIDTIWEEPERELWIAVCERCGKEFEWLKEIEPNNDSPVTVHLNADKNLSPETADALAEMVRLAVKAINEGTLPKKKVVQNLCPNCGELITFDEDYLRCPYCDYGEDYPYSDED